MTDLTGKTIGRYHVLEVIGRGGMAVVYRAYDSRLRREVALKVIRRENVPQEQLQMLLKRFEREALALARLSHPNIVNVHDYGDYEGEPYLVMELVEGGTLSQRMGEAWTWRDAARMLAPVARGLEYAHAHNLVHRDVKPGNILLTEGNIPKISDFGIAKLLEQGEMTLTGTGIGIGSPEYMAPEQGMGGAVDARADIYSLGVVFYEMVTGHKPFTADTPLAVVYKHMHDPLPRPRQYVPHLPDEVEKTLFMALAKKPEDRYAHMAEFAAQLERLAAGQAEAAAAVTQTAPTPPVHSPTPLPPPVMQYPAPAQPISYPAPAQPISYPAPMPSGQVAEPKRSSLTPILIVGGILLALLCLLVLLLALLPGPRAGIAALLRSPTPTSTNTPRPTRTERPSETPQPTATQTTRPTFTAVPQTGGTPTMVGGSALPVSDHYEDFSASPCPWYEYFGDDGSRYCENDAYTIVANPEIAIWTWGSEEVADAAFASDITIERGTDASAAIFCRYSYDDANGVRAYYGHVYSTGYAAIGIFNGAENYVLTEWLTPSILRSGYNVTNRVEFSCIGNVLTLRINGLTIASVTDDSGITYGSAGVFLFAGSDQAEGTFDNFSIDIP